MTPPRLRNQGTDEDWEDGEVVYAYVEEEEEYDQ